MYNDLTHFIGNVHRYSIKTLIWNKGTIVFYVIYSIAIFNFIFGEKIHPAPKEWLDTIKENCADVAGDIFKYDDAETENFVRFNLASTIAGSYIGLIIEQRWIGTRKYKKFSKTAPFTTLKRIIFTTFVGSPVLCGIVLTPSTGIHWSTKLLFKVVIPISLGNLYLFGFSKYVGLKFGLINTTLEGSNISSVATDSTDECSEPVAPNQEKALKQKKVD